MTPADIESTIKWLLESPDTLWIQHPDCLARVFGWSEATLTALDTKWQKVMGDPHKKEMVLRKLDMIMRGEIVPTPVKRQYAGGWNSKGAYAPREEIEWLPCRPVDPKPIKRAPMRLGVRLSSIGPRVVVNVPR